jgi:hypothetical protein
MAFNMNNLLKDKIVLYVVFFFAVTNLFGYILVGNLEAVIGFVLIGYVTTFFSKNMIIVMLSAMLLTNLLVASQNNNIQEGMDHDGKEKKENKLPKKKLKKDDDDDEDVLLLDKKITKKLANGGQEVENGVVVEKAKGGKINYAETLEEAYDNLDKMLGGEAMNRMSQDAGRLAEKQVKLMENMQQLEPLMNKASTVMEGLDFDKINSMVSGFSKQLDGLGLNTKSE